MEELERLARAAAEADRLAILEAAEQLEKQNADTKRKRQQEVQRTEQQARKKERDVQSRAEEREYARFEASQPWYLKSGWVVIEATLVLIVILAAPLAIEGQSDWAFGGSAVLGLVGFVLVQVLADHLRGERPPSSE